MPLDILKLITERAGQNHDLHERYINPQFSKVLKTIGFNRNYVRAHGPFLYDDKGDEYLDFLSGYGVFSIGRNHPGMKKVLHDFLDLDTASLIQMEAPLLSGLLSEALIKRIAIPGIDTVYLTNSGTEAVETAIKFARAATGKTRILFLDHAFHGLTTGSLSLNGGEHFREGFGTFIHDCAKIPFNDLTRLEEELKKKDVAAFFFEPIQGKGVYIPDDNFLPQAQALCRKYDTLFVADEVQTGFGRTGKWFAYEHWNLEPDIITMAKALSGGFVPVGAVATRRWVYDKVFSRMDRCVVHSSTFGQNNMAMVCALASLQIIEEENLVERARILGEQFLAGLNMLKSRHEWVKEARGKGLMVGLEFGKPKSMANKLRWELVHKLDRGLFGELIVMPLMVKHHILSQVTGHHQAIIKFIPPLVIDETHIDRCIGALDQVLTECNSVTGPIWDMGKNIFKHAISNKKAAASS